jgi:hypothetical protein
MVAEGKESTGAASACLLLAIREKHGERAKALLGHFVRPLEGGEWNPRLLAMLRRAKRTLQGSIRVVGRGMSFLNEKQHIAQRRTQEYVQELLRSAFPQAEMDLRWSGKESSVEMTYDAEQGQGKIISAPGIKNDVLADVPGATQETF